MKFKRQTKIHKRIIPTILVAGIFQFFLIILLELTISSALSYLFIFIGILAIIFIVLKYGRPLASIKQELLMIHGEKINKNEIEYMKYEVNSNKNHYIVVKKNGLSEKIIALPNQYNELRDLKLYNFLAKNFYPIELVKNETLIRKKMY